MRAISYQKRTREARHLLLLLEFRLWSWRPPDPYLMRLACLVIAALAASMPLYAQQSTVPDRVGTVASLADVALPAGFAGAVPPTLPATVARDEEGRTTVRIVRLSAPLRIDGRLDEDLYRHVS